MVCFKIKKNILGSTHLDCAPLFVEMLLIVECQVFRIPGLVRTNL
jgi:hypothetical protein